MSIRDLWLGFLVIFIWAANTAVIKYITLEVEPFTGLLLRLMVTCLFFAPFFRFTNKKQFVIMVQLTLLMAVLHWGTLIWAIDKLDVTISSILLQTQVIFSVLLAVLIFKETVGWKTISGITLGILGVVILVGMPQTPPSIPGAVVIIISMIAVASAYARQKNLGEMGAMNFIAHMHILALPPVAVLTFIFEDPLATNWANINMPMLSTAFIFQAFIVSMSHMLWQRLIARNAMSILPNLTLLLPILGVIFGIVFFDETLTPPMIIGGAVTTFGVAIIMIRKRAKIAA